MLGRIIVLLALILALLGGGLVWFDYLNVIDAKTVLAPLYKLIGREGRTQGQLGEDEYLNLDAERLAVRLEAEALRELDMEKKEADLDSRQGEIEQMAEELEAQRQALEDLQNSINQGREAAEIVDRNVEGIAQQLNGMAPERAVAIIAEMNDQQAIGVLRKTEEMAQRDGTNSIVPYWMSLMPPQRAAELQRKMVGGGISE
jgi:flagellar protein FlbB